MKNALKTNKPLSPMALIYLDDLGKLFRLTSTELNVLKQIVPQIELDNNRIFITKSIKVSISNILNLSERTIANALANLVKKEMLISFNRYEYKAPVSLFGTKCWDDVKTLRVSFEFTNSGEKMKLEEIPKDNK